MPLVVHVNYGSELEIKVLLGCVAAAIVDSSGKGSFSRWLKRVFALVLASSKYYLYISKHKLAKTIA